VPAPSLLLLSGLLPGVMHGLLACSPQAHPTQLTVYAEPSLQVPLQAFVDHLGDPRVRLVTASDPSTQAGLDSELAIVLGSLDDCGECYRLEATDLQIQVDAGGLLGAQYGLAEALEALGYRFPHPFQSRLPAVLPRGLPDSDPVLGRTFRPEEHLRGLHLHTLHPIESLWGFWTQPPGGDGADALLTADGRADAVIDWVIKNRGNALQWVALDDIITSPDLHTTWLARTQAINDRAHARGLSTSIGIQLFGSGNLQKAFDLLDDPADTAGWQDAIDHRLALVTDAGFDRYDLSFGEFFSEDPEAFIQAVDLTYARLQVLDPGSELDAVIHVGKRPEQHVEYKGQAILYYMLVQYADPAIVPHIHTVMYYNLFDDAGGAYGHEDFSEHRQYLMDRLAADQPVAYFPESSYWVAFDNPVPLFLPLYVRSRWSDLQRIRAATQEAGSPDLDEHMLFSTGWEWGYWQNDAFTLRMGWSLPADWGDLYRDWFSVDGAEGLALAQAVVDLGETQQVALIDQRGAAYLAGRDATMDIGYNAGIVGAPDRVELAALATMEPADQQAFADALLPTLEGLEAATADAESRISALSLVDRDPWAAEIRDGVQIDLLRTRFVRHLYQAVLAADPAPDLAAADQAWSQARTVVDRRHAALHDPLGSVLIDDNVPNPTIYDYGYLVRAEDLCFWERQRVQAAQVLEGSTELPPPCF